MDTNRIIMEELEKKYMMPFNSLIYKCIKMHENRKFYLTISVMLFYILLNLGHFF